MSIISPLFQSGRSLIISNLDDFPYENEKKPKLETVGKKLNFMVINSHGNFSGWQLQV